jgi:hypothetical protein
MHPINANAAENPEAKVRHLTRFRYIFLLVPPVELTLRPSTLIFCSEDFSLSTRKWSGFVARGRSQPTQRRSQRGTTLARRVMSPPSHY